jgi:flagellar biosynthesis protein FlhA
VQREADFYAAMDGAGKFVKGDAIAALIIVALNLIGGVVVGPCTTRWRRSTRSDVRDPLDRQRAAHDAAGVSHLDRDGLMVTRVAGDGALGVDLAAQLLARPDVLRVAGVLVLALASSPRFRACCSSCSVRSRSAPRRSPRAAMPALEAARRRSNSADAATRCAGRRRPSRWSASMRSRSRSAPTCIRCSSPPNCDALLDRIGDVRRSLAAEIGIVIPGVRLRDDPLRDPRTYAIRVRDRAVAEGIVRLDRLVAVGAPEQLRRIEGEPTHEPVYGLAARWIPYERREAAQEAGALTFDAVSIIGSHLAEAVRSHAGELFGRQEFAALVEHLRISVPSLVKDVGGDVLPAAAAHRAMLWLLRERVWPRDPIALFEALLDAAAASRDPRELAEGARRALVPQQLRRDGVQRLRPLILAPHFEAELTAMWSPEGGLAPEPQTALHVRDAVARFTADGAFAPHALDRDRAAAPADGRVPRPRKRGTLRLRVRRTPAGARARAGRDHRPRAGAQRRGALSGDAVAGEAGAARAAAGDDQRRVDAAVAIVLRDRQRQRRDLRRRDVDDLAAGEHTR